MEDTELSTSAPGLPVGAPRSGISFSRQTLRLIALLESTSQDLADMLKGAWAVLESADNPDMLSQAGHSMRELIEKAPFSIPGVPVLAASPRHKDRVRGETRRNQIQATVRTLAGTDGRISEQIVEAQSQVIMTLRSYFMDDAAHHGRTTEMDEMRRSILELENVLLNLLAPESIDDLDKIDDLIASGESSVTTGLVEKVLKKINSTQVVRDHFFKSINNPEWLEPLDKNQVFDNPIKEVYVDGGMWFPAWEEGEYLVRIADKKPDEVMAILKKLPDTNNERVMVNVVQALLKIDSSKAIDLVDRVKGYIEKPQYLLLDGPVGDLIVKLACDGAADEAIELAAAALKIMPDPEATAEADKTWLYPKTWYRSHAYEEIVKKITPALTGAAPDKAVAMYATVVGDYTRYKHSDIKPSKKHKDTLEDWSMIWRPVIEESGEYPDTIDTLINALLDSLAALVQSDKMSDTDKAQALNGLLEAKLSIIKRSVEYALRDHHKAQELADIHKPLAKEFASIIKQPAVRFGGGGWVGEKHAMSQEEFDALDDDTLIEKLKTYEPESSLYSDREALGNNVEAAAKHDPERFMGLLPKIAETKPVYLYSAIEAFYKNVDSLTPKQIGKASKAILGVLGSTEPKGDEESRDYYKWARASAASFAERAFDKNEDKSHEHISAKEADVVLDLTLLLCQDDDPTVEYEKKEEGNLDPATLSLNTIRGKAMHGIIHAMIWANRNKPGDEFKNKVFDELTRSLEDPTQTIRTVYGMYFSPIYHTRKEWAEKNKDAIFSDDILGQAAIDTYTRYSSVALDAMEILGDVYRQQLPRLTIQPPDEKKRSTAREGLRHLVQHLSLHYWYGQTDLSEGSIMRELLNTAHPKYLAEAVNFIGFRLYKADEREREVTDEELTRLASLWDSVVEVVKADNSKKEALEDFGAWFASGKFDDDWSLDRLLEALKIAGSVDLDFAVLERLEKLVTAHSAKAVGIINAMVDGATRDRWAIGSWRDNAMSILKTAGQSSDTNIKQSVRDLANKLVSKGYEEYRKVI